MYTVSTQSPVQLSEARRSYHERTIALRYVDGGGVEVGAFVVRAKQDGIRQECRDLESEVVSTD
jgi:hypothetical protein